MKRSRLKQLEVWKMANIIIQYVKKIFYIAEKDVKIYFFKGPNLTFGLLLPVVLYLAFAIGRTVDPTFAVPGLVAIAAFFGAGAIQAISLPLERRTGTFNSLVTAPISLSTIILGKALAGFFFGIVLSLTYTAIMLPFSPLPNLPLLIMGILVSSFMFSAFGLFLSAPFRDIPQAMPPATVVRIAMVFLGGVFTPITMLPAALQTVAYALPLTYSVSSLRQAWSGNIDLQMFFVDFSIQIVFAIIFLIAASKILYRTIE
jgi:ABC-2 type transport system permease protein